MLIAFFDIDGVLADCSHRLHYLKDKDYDSFYNDEALMKDEAIKSGKSLLQALENRYRIVFVTGRPERTRSTTKKWIEENLGSYFATFPLAMRKDGDYRPSEVIKKEIIGGCKFNGEAYDVLFVDDDPKNCKALDGMEYDGTKITSLLFRTGRLEEK